MKSRGIYIKPLDAAAVLLVAASIVVIAFSVYGERGSGSTITIQTDEGVELYPLDQDRIVRARGPLGETVIEISGSVVRVVSSPCRDKLCIRKGDLDSSGEWTACMPNRVFIRIGGSDGGFDDLSY